MAKGPMQRDAREGESGRGCRAWSGRSRVDDTQVHLREPSGYSAREGGEGPQEVGVPRKCTDAGPRLQETHQIARRGEGGTYYVSGGPWGNPGGHP